MGVENRDWFWEDRKRREQEYGGDFSLHSKKITPNESLAQNRKVPSQTKKATIKNNIYNVVTIAGGFLLFWAIKSYSLIPGLLNVNGPDGLRRILMLGCGLVLGIAFFVYALKRRNKSDKGILNVLALIASMLMVIFSGLFLLMVVMNLS